MSNIKQLPQDVANQISAGEVVERPASVVKELVENSIDAESNKIRIEVKEGGKKLIRVKDNGHGIEKEEMELAFSRYATSKINKVSDIYSLKTLGFRGEALASIAAVSKVKALSRKKDAVKGLSIELEGGELKKKEIVGCPQGTDISVSDLFFNTPARFKYMKTVSTEFNHISRVVTGEALPYSEIKFNLSHNSKSVI
ncbi:MAG: DNA mismatch repair endonuclease MutL, partial [Halanaerobiales bacterium]